MNREMNYLEEFLFSAQDKIENLKVTTEPANTDDYKYLIVDFDKMTYKINKDLVFNFCNIYQKLNKDEEVDSLEVEVNPYLNLGKVKEKNLKIDSSIIMSEDEVSELIEKIVSKIYEKYNFLILPATEEDVESIVVKDYIKSPYESASEQNKSQGQNLYSIGFKIKAEFEKEVEYFPFKIYFRILEKKNSENGDSEIGIDIAEEFNSIVKANKINILTARKFSQREKANLKKKFENKEFEADKEKISSNIDKIINQVLLHISSYVAKFDEAPAWFQDSELGKFIKNARIKSDEPQINAIASFRYITQTPLPYNYINVRFKNKFSTDVYQIKKGPKNTNELNDMLNVCPMCSQPINENNKIVASNEYVDKFLGCQKCMTVKCSVCDNVWSKEKKPTPINRKISGKYYYMAGSCNAPFATMDEFYGAELCSEHARRCFNPSCEGNIYSESMIEKCSNADCDKTYCLNHSEIDLYKCETSVCASSQFPNRYCSDCKDRFLNTCGFCGKTMCQSCSRPVMKQNNLGNFEFANDEFICLDCLNKLTNGLNLETNKANNALMMDDDSKYYPKAIEYLKPYGDNPDQFIDQTIAFLAYKDSKPKDYLDNPEKGKLYYKEKEVVKCNNCEQFFRFTSHTKYNKDKNYCRDCLVKCSMCEEVVVASDVISLDGVNYCKYCYDKKWEISDLNTDNAPFNEDKLNIVKTVFANPNLKNSYGIVPVAKKDLFLCPETEYKVSPNQTRYCLSCKETYAITNFSANNQICKLCENLKNFDYNQDKDLLIKAFYNKSFGYKKRFKAYCTKNTLLISYLRGVEENINVYRFNKKKGKYVYKSTAKEVDENPIKEASKDAKQ